MMGYINFTDPHVNSTSLRLLDNTGYNFCPLGADRLFVFTPTPSPRPTFCLNTSGQLLLNTSHLGHVLLGSVHIPLISPCRLGVPNWNLHTLRETVDRIQASMNLTGRKSLYLHPFLNESQHFSFRYGCKQQNTGVSGVPVTLSPGQVMDICILHL